MMSHLDDGAGAEGRPIVPMTFGLTILPAWALDQRA
jgi:hypothetical protein